MKRLITLTLIIALTSTGFAQSNSEAKPDNSSQVDALMAQWSQGDAPGAAIIVIKDGKVVHSKGYGLANLKTKEPITAKTVFDIGSVAKQFTAMAIMILVERGKLNYTDPLSKFFSEFPPAIQQITIRQLLNHTSGIKDFIHSWGNDSHTNDEVVKFVAGQKRLRFKPGEKWEYSNSNYVLLAQIVSKMSGKPFPQFMRKNIFQPLGMNDSYVYDETSIKRGQQTIGYASDGKGFKSFNLHPENYLSGEGQAHSTIEDMAKWDAVLYTERLVKTSTLKEAFTLTRLTDGTPINYGYGWGFGKYRGLNFISHAGESFGFVAQITRFTEQHFTVIVLSNYQQFTSVHSVANKIADIYLADKLKSPALIKIPPERLQDYVGKYSVDELKMQITLEADSLWAIGGKSKAKLVPVSEEEFLVEGSKYQMSIGFSKNNQRRISCLSLLDQNGINLCKE